MLDLADKKCAVIGGGNVAERKILELIDCGAKISVISPDINKTIELLASSMPDKVRLIRKRYKYGDLKKFDLKEASLVIAATNDSETNRIVSKEAKKLLIPVNVADTPQLCTFIFPAVIRRGNLCISVSTESRFPGLARKIKEKIEKSFDMHYSNLVSLMGRIRCLIIEKEDNHVCRKKKLNQLLDLSEFILSRLREGFEDKAIENEIRSKLL